MAPHAGAGVTGDGMPPVGGIVPAWVLLTAGSLAVMLAIVFALNAGRYGVQGLIIAPLLLAGGAWAVRRGFRVRSPADG